MKIVSVGKKLVDKLVAKCTENIDEVKLAEINLAGYENVCVCSYTICAILTVIALTISIGIGLTLLTNT